MYTLQSRLVIRYMYKLSWDKRGAKNAFACMQGISVRVSAVGVDLAGDLISLSDEQWPNSAR